MWKTQEQFFTKGSIQRKGGPDAAFLLHAVIFFRGLRPSGDKPKGTPVALAIRGVHAATFGLFPGKNGSVRRGYVN
jgi:hypothetical protein